MGLLSTMEPSEAAEGAEGQGFAAHGAPAPGRRPAFLRRLLGEVSLRELRDRKVVQWTAAYVGAAWLLSQVLGFAVATFSWPMPVLRVAVVFLAFGVPAVLVLSWCHGDKGRQRVGRGEMALLALILVAALGVGVLAGRGDDLAGDQASMASAPPAPVAAKQANSVAVLPFLNMSSEPETEYFSDGMTEELINTLARVDGLKVAARSSAFQFKGAAVDARDVGERLGVAAVIEGSVRKSRDRLRISVQLVDTTRGYQIWSETYDRELTDVFAVQEEIAQAVVAALRVRLSAGRARLTADHTDDLDAYQAYLRGRFFWNKRNGDGLQKALVHFQQAIEHDPDYALAYAGLADTYLLLPLHTTMSTREAFPKAKATAQRAVALDPDLAEAHTSLAYVLFWNDWNYPAAERAFRRAIELNPNYPTAHHWFSEFLITSGRVDEAVAEAARAQALDPLSLIISTDAAANFYFARRYDEAVERLKRVLELDPDFQVARWFLGKSYVQQGKHAAAIAELQKAARAPGAGDWSRAYLAHAYGAAGRRDDARAVLAEMTRQSKVRYVRPDVLAALHLAAGDKEQALDQLERAVQERAVYPFIMARDPQLDPLRSDPRFAALLKRMNISR